MCVFVKFTFFSIYFELLLLLLLLEFRGKIYVDVREYYEKDGEMLPGKKGISLTVEQWEKLKALIPKIDDALAAKDN